MNYMRTVKRRLEVRRVPLFVAQAQVDQSFAELTRIGLARAKGMVEYAHVNKLHIFYLSH